MKLQIESIDLNTVQSGPETRLDDRTFSINFKEVQDVILEDPRIQSVELELVCPKDPVRIVNVVDVIQPRCKIDKVNSDFPGWLGKLSITGEGRSRSLRNLNVAVCNPYSRRPYAALFDMFGPGAEESLYGKMHNLCVIPCPSENTEELDFEMAVKSAGLKAAVHLARAAGGSRIDETEIFDLSIPEAIGSSGKNLPRVAYYYQVHAPQHDYLNVGEPILYGTETTNLLPTLIHPNEVLDGAILNTHTVRGMTTHTIQNHPTIMELYRRHERDLIFVGVVMGVACVDPIQRKRMSMMAANLIANVLGADGVIMSKIHGGMPHADLGLVGEECEKLGVKTALFANVYGTSGAIADYLLFNAESLDAIVSVGQFLDRIQLPRAERISGGTADTLIYNPDRKQKAGDETIEVERFLLAGAYDYLGGSTLIAVEN